MMMRSRLLCAGALVCALLLQGPAFSISAGASDMSLAGVGASDDASDHGSSGAVSAQNSVSGGTDAQNGASGSAAAQNGTSGSGTAKDGAAGTTAATADGDGQTAPITSISPDGTSGGGGQLQTEAPETEAPAALTDDMLTVLGSHSTLTNEGVAEEYEWVKTNLAGEFMPYVISHAEGNPNVIHFLYMDGHDTQSPEEFAYTDEERQHALPMLGDGVTGLVPLLMQWDWRWGFDHYGGGPAGLTACAPTCMAMIGFGLTGDESITPRSMCTRAENSGYWVSGQGTSWDFVLNAFPDHAVYGQRISADQYTIKAQLDAGYPVLINVGVGKFSAVGHFMVLAGTDADGKFILNDPNNLENCQSTWSWDDLGPEVTAAWSYSYSG